MKTIWFFVLFILLTTRATANSANISCGQPTAATGMVTVTVTFDDKTSVTWTTAGILSSDSPAEKATKIRAAAPPAAANLLTDAGSGTVAGGAANAVSCTSVAGVKITGMAFTADTTNEKEAHNVFSAVLSDSNGIYSLAGSATGQDWSGNSAVVTATASGVTASVATFPGMTAAHIEDLVLQQLNAGGVLTNFADPSQLAANYPGLEGDGRLLQIVQIDSTGLEVNNSDTGIVSDVAGLIDTAAGGPASFCTSKPSSLPSCVPALTGTGTTVSKTTGTFTVMAAPVPGGAGKPGILIWTKNGLLGTPVNTSFGFLCLAQFQRAGNFPASPGGTSGVCDGTYNWPFQSIVASFGAIAPGNTLHVQGWYRDSGFPPPDNANFTNGIGPINVIP